MTAPALVIMCKASLPCGRVNDSTATSLTASMMTAGTLYSAQHVSCSSSLLLVKVVNSGKITVFAKLANGCMILLHSNTMECYMSFSLPRQYPQGWTTCLQEQQYIGPVHCIAFTLLVL